MKAKDVMTTEVLTVTPDTTVEEIAKLMLEHRISGVPVADEQGAVLGIVSEGDLIRRPEIGTDQARRATSWFSIFSSLCSSVVTAPTRPLARGRFAGGDEG